MIMVSMTLQWHEAKHSFMESCAAAVFSVVYCWRGERMTVQMLRGPAAACIVFAGVIILNRFSL